MCSRFQIGSNRPFAKRSARMFSTDSLPRKWSIRKTSASRRPRGRPRSARAADARSVPNGFSMITRARSVELRSRRASRRRRERGGRDREVVEAARPAADLLLRPRDGGDEVVVRAAVEAVEERDAVPLAPPTAALSSATRAVRADLLLPELRPRRADDAEPLGHQARDSEVEEARRILRLARSPVAPNRTTTWFGGLRRASSLDASAADRRRAAR